MLAEFQQEPPAVEWSSNFYYDHLDWLLPESFVTKRELLDYPNPEGLHPVEASWRDFARQLLMTREHCICDGSGWLELPEGGAIGCHGCQVEAK